MSNITIAGGDKRNLYIAQKLYSKNCDVSSLYIENSPCDIGAKFSSEILKKSKIVILPLPVTKDGSTLNTPLYKENICLNELLGSLSADSLIFGGKIDTTEFKKHSLTAYDYAEREDFATLNAVPTAEGAIEAVMKMLPTTLFGSKVLICGFGKIAKVLAMMLKNMGAYVTIAARKSGDLAMAKALGLDSVKICAMRHMLKDCDVIFNTVPFKIFNEDELNCIAPNTPFADLASAPGGTDRDMALEKNIKYVLLPGLPGKYSPSSAADIILETIENIIAESGKDAKLWIYAKKE